MADSGLEKILRLAGGNTPKRPVPPGRLSQLRLGTPFRAAWGNVTVGDVVEFGAELWKVIPSSSYPKHKKPGAASSAPGPGIPKMLATPPQPPGAVAAAGPPQPGGPPPPGGQPADQQQPGMMPSPQPGGMSATGSMPTSTLYLQDVRHPTSYDELTLPTSHVVSVVPVLP